MYSTVSGFSLPTEPVRVKANAWQMMVQFAVISAQTENPVTFLAFLAEVIRQTMLEKDSNESIDLCQIITKAAGDRMGLPIDADQLQLLSS